MRRQSGASRSSGTPKAQASPPYAASCMPPVYAASHAASCAASYADSHAASYAASCAGGGSVPGAGAAPMSLVSYTVHPPASVSTAFARTRESKPASGAGSSHSSEGMQGIGCRRRVSCRHRITPVASLQFTVPMVPNQSY